MLAAAAQSRRSALRAAVLPLLAARRDLVAELL